MNCVPISPYLPTRRVRHLRNAMALLHCAARPVGFNHCHYFTTTHLDVQLIPSGTPPRCAPKGVVVLVASDARWLDCMVEFPGGRVKIGPSATDYIFVRKEAWEKCWENQGAESHMEAAAGSGTGMACSLSKEAVLSLAGSILALYEAKTDAGLRKLGSVRGQALLQYLAINYMKNWPARESIRGTEQQSAGAAGAPAWNRAAWTPLVVLAWFWAPPHECSCS